MFTAVIAASGGLLFGYDLGVTGGVESMDSFLSKFFPDVYEKKQADADNHSPCELRQAPCWPAAPTVGWHVQGQLALRACRRAGKQRRPPGTAAFGKRPASPPAAPCRLHL